MEKQMSKVEAQNEGFHAAMMGWSAVCPFADALRGAWITGYMLGLELVDEK